MIHDIIYLLKLYEILYVINNVALVAADGFYFTSTIIRHYFYFEK